MSEPDYKKLYDKIMHGAQARMSARARRALDRQRKALKQYNVRLSSIRLHRDDEAECVIEQIEYEIANLSSQRDRTSSMSKRVELKAAIVHLRDTIERIKGNNKRKPPESGIAVPAVPPKGPMPKQGGAEAPLDYGV